MDSGKRKEEILKILSERDSPVSALSLAQKFGVTRQVIVKDMAVIKAGNKNIISTARGYLLHKPENQGVSRTVKVCHGASEIENELNLIVDLGGYVVSTAIEHPVYGIIGETLNIKSRKDVKNFLRKIEETGCEPLLRLTQGRHMHIIEAESEEGINDIIEALKLNGYIDGGNEG